MAAKKILIFMGSVRPGRIADRVCIAVKNLVAAQGMDPEVIDPAELPLEIVKVPLFFMKNPATEAPDWLRELDNKIQKADGYIIVSAEYNAGIPPALSNMLDHIPAASFRHRPCGIVTYSPGTYGGIRASMVLRPFISELGMISTPFYTSIPKVHECINEVGECTSERIGNNLAKLVKEVEWYADAIRKHKETVPPPSQ